MTKNEKENEILTTTKRKALFFIFSAIFFIILMSFSFVIQNKSHPSRTKITKKESKKSTDIITIKESTASTLCNSIARKLAIYDFKESYDSTIFDRDDHWEVIVKNIKYQNAFGVWEKKNVWCRVEKEGKRELVDYYSHSLVREYKVY